MNSTDISSFNVDPQSLQKTLTHIEGLDAVLHGGIPSGRLTIINGGPGAGKTILGLEILLRGVEAGNPAVYVSFEESKDSINLNALSLGWDVEEFEAANKLVLINPEVKYEALLAGEFDIDGFCAILEGQAKKIGAKLIVIDALDILLSFFNESTKARKQVAKLNKYLNEKDFTVIITVKSHGDTEDGPSYLDFMADCVIRLDQRISQQVTTRRLYINKYRGSDFASREHPFIISSDGIVVMPLTFISMTQEKIGDPISTHHSKLDKILGGGYREGSMILICGPTGSGKTTLAFAMTTEVAKTGKKVLFINYEQSAQILIHEMKGVGYDIQPLIDSDNLRVMSVVPESMGMEEHLYQIIKETDEYKPDVITIDAISATNRMGSLQAASEFLIRLFHRAKEKGITCISTSQTTSILENNIEISELNIASLVDTAIILSYRKENEYISRRLLVLKSRGNKHSPNYHKFSITNHGIVIENSVK